MDRATAAQLGLLAEIAAALDGAGIAWWLFGGWAMDAHAGRITRDHGDIEFFIMRDDADAVRRALVRRGFAATDGRHPDEGQPFVKQGQEAGAWFLTVGEDGRPRTPGRWDDWPWPAGSFDGPRRQLEGLDLPVMSIEGLLELKTKFASHAHGAPLRPKDTADIALLRSLLGRQ